MPDPYPQDAAGSTAYGAPNAASNTAGPGGTTAGGPGVEASVGTLLTEVTRDLSTLLRQEFELAKAEMRQEATKAGKGAGLLGGSGYAGHLTMLFASLALMFLLDVWMPIGWAALIVAVIWGITAAVLFSRGRRELKNVDAKPQQTIDSLKEDVQWAKTRTR